MNRYKTLRLLNLMCIAVIINGCTIKEPVFADFIGVWTSEDGCKITLNKDSTCVVEKLDKGKLYDLTEDTLYTFIAKWSIEVAELDFGQKEYNIIIGNDSIYSYESFIISGQGLLKNTPPWNFFQFIGDPDDLNLYEFKKQE